MAREKRWDVDVEGYELLDLSVSHSCVRARTHGCYSVRRYPETVSQQQETLSQHTPAMKVRVGDIGALSDDLLVHHEECELWKVSLDEG